MYQVVIVMERNPSTDSDLTKLSQCLEHLTISPSDSTACPDNDTKEEEKVVTPPSLLDCSDAIHDLIELRLRQALRAMSADSLYDWKESNLQSTLVTVLSNEYFEDDVNYILSRVSGNASVQVTVVEEDPIWVDPSPFIDERGLRTHDNALAKASIVYEKGTGKRLYSDVTLYILDKDSKSVLIMQIELKYVNMKYAFENDRANPLSTGRSHTGEFQAKRVLSHKFMRYFEDIQLQKELPVEEYSFISFNPDPRKRTTTLGAMHTSIHGRQVREQLRHKTHMTRIQLYVNPEYDEVKIVNHLLVGYVNMIHSTKTGERVLIRIKGDEKKEQNEYMIHSL